MQRPNVSVTDGLGEYVHSIAAFGFYPRLPGMFSPLRFARLAQDVPCPTISTGLTICHVALDASSIAGDTREFRALPWRLRHVADLEK